jgi:hypothetical protein
MKRKSAANNSAEARELKRKRKAKVLDMLSNGVPYINVRNMCAKEFEVTTRTVEKYIAEVRADIKSCYSATEIKLIVAEAIMKAERLYARAIAEKDLKTALGTLRWIGELYGIHGSMQVARLHSENQARLMALTNSAEQTGTDERKGGQRASLPKNAHDEARAAYGLPPTTTEAWETWHKGHKAESN